MAFVDMNKAVGTVVASSYGHTIRLDMQQGSKASREAGGISDGMALVKGSQYLLGTVSRHSSVAAVDIFFVPV